MLKNSNEAFVRPHLYLPALIIGMKHGLQLIMLWWLWQSETRMNDFTLHYYITWGKIVLKQELLGSKPVSWKRWHSFDLPLHARPRPSFTFLAFDNKHVLKKEKKNLAQSFQHLGLQPTSANPHNLSSKFQHDLLPLHRRTRTIALISAARPCWDHVRSLLN